MVVIQTFENVFLGITGSQWIMFAEAIICAVLVLFILILVTYAGPTLEYIIARFQKKSNVAIVIQNHDIKIKTIDYFAGIFENKLGLTWLQRKRENHNFGACNCEIVADFWGLTMDLKTNIATKAFIDKWNDPECEDYMGIKERALIKDPDSLFDALEQCDDDEEIKIKAFCYVPIHQLRNYFPEELTASMIAGHVEALKKLDMSKISAGASAWWIPVVCLIAGLILGFVGGNFA
jgi:hypothetical protein